MSHELKLLDSYTEFDDTADGLLIKRAQEIPDDFISNLKKQKVESANRREGNFMHVASIPVIIHEKWLKDGFDCTREPYKETLKRLRNEGLDAFIVTNKRV
jgi:hypothetical protein